MELIIHFSSLDIQLGKYVKSDLKSREDLYLLPFDVALLRSRGKTMWDGELTKNSGCYLLCKTCNLDLKVMEAPHILQSLEHVACVQRIAGACTIHTPFWKILSFIDIST